MSNSDIVGDVIKDLQTSVLAHQASAAASQAAIEALMRLEADRKEITKEKQAAEHDRAGQSLLDENKIKDREAATRVYMSKLDARDESIKRLRMQVVQTEAQLRCEEGRIRDKNEANAFLRLQVQCYEKALRDKGVDPLTVESNAASATHTWRLYGDVKLKIRAVVDTIELQEPVQPAALRCLDALAEDWRELDSDFANTLCAKEPAADLCITQDFSGDRSMWTDEDPRKFACYTCTAAHKICCVWDLAEKVILLLPLNWELRSDKAETKQSEKGYWVMDKSKMATNQKRWIFGL